MDGGTRVCAMSFNIILPCTPVGGPSPQLSTFWLILIMEATTLIMSKRSLSNTAEFIISVGNLSHFGRPKSTPTQWAEIKHPSNQDIARL